MNALVKYMKQSNFYPHGVENVEFIQTHSSCVFLTGKYAYKVKKAVDFGFLDYSTLEKRKHYCEEEVRLNRLGAGDLYLGVVPIFRHPEAQTYSMVNGGGGGEVVEYAVKMIQFPQEALLSQIFKRGELTEALLCNLAHTIADYHARTETGEAIRAFGSTENVQAAFLQNYEQTECFVGSLQTRARFDATRAATGAFFRSAAGQALLRRRADGGFVRGCHGDLHLNNVCCVGGRVLLFDCIEFNASFRCVDTVSDVAFVTMDLLVGGRPDLAASFLSAYAERSGDWEGLQLLPLYLSRQAYVRAKVDCFLTRDAAVSAAARAAAAATAETYFELAYSSVCGGKRGCLLLMCGLSGSGKSTVASRLVGALAVAAAATPRSSNGTVHIRSDAVRKHLAGIPLASTASDSSADGGGAAAPVVALYSAEMSGRVYARLLQLGLLLAGCGFTPILDAKYDRVARRRVAVVAAAAAQLPLHFLHCTAPAQVLRQRVAARRQQQPAGGSGKGGDGSGGQKGAAAQVDANTDAPVPPELALSPPPAAAGGSGGVYGELITDATLEVLAGQRWEPFGGQPEAQEQAATGVQVLRADTTLPLPQVVAALTRQLTPLLLAPSSSSTAAEGGEEAGEEEEEAKLEVSALQA